MREPIRILSDVHFRHPSSFVEELDQLRPLLRGAGTVVFNGDSVEMRFPGERQQGMEALALLRDLCQREKVDAVFINGNHDPAVSEVNHLDLCNGAVFVTHGDALFPDISPWSPKAGVIGSAHRRELEKLDLKDDLEERLNAAKRATLSIEMKKPVKRRGFRGRLWSMISEMWPPRRPFQILRVWIVTPRLAARFARRYRPAAAFVIIGHVHHAALNRIHGRQVINTGSFLPPLGRLCVDMKDDRICVRKIERRNGAFHPGRVVGEFRARPLGGPQINAPKSRG